MPTQQATLSCAVSSGLGWIYEFKTDPELKKLRWLSTTIIQTKSPPATSCCESIAADFCASLTITPAISHFVTPFSSHTANKDGFVDGQVQQTVRTVLRNPPRKKFVPGTSG
ncbi:hypothetical protein PGTUg99_000712 [Puccinia graminis f. sp. tritici]|uniref:Uncharacterized protein n=1 Tax=Puccinia graminis f. sp. tritici TaxID=56615 RepID=A0A5B0PVJ8_PUCGR|nr:hypothetical protein PGTUg99_000712 [Puccinia graminis f. sp. tritici]